MKQGALNKWIKEVFSSFSFLVNIKNCVLILLLYSQNSHNLNYSVLKYMTFFASLKARENKPFQDLVGRGALAKCHQRVHFNLRPRAGCIPISMQRETVASFYLHFYIHSSFPPGPKREERSAAMVPRRPKSNISGSGMWTPPGAQ